MTCLALRNLMLREARNVPSNQNRPRVGTTFGQERQHMFSLPDINALNARAKSCATAFDKECNPPKRHKHSCEYCTKKASYHHKWFDIFSDDAKGVVHLCEYHEQSGVIEEDRFTCHQCERLMVRNYTWELYSKRDEYGREICLACAAKNYFADDSNLIEPEKLKVVTNAAGPLWNEEMGAVCLRGVQHVLGVKQPIPEGIEFVENFENCNDRGLFDAEAIERAIKELGKPCFLVMDAAYQFSVSIGIYVRK